MARIIAQAACIGFANLFGRAGLLSTGNEDKDGKESGKKFEIISTNSGGSWFSTQFFFSKEFHKLVMTVDAGDGDDSAVTMRKLVQDWMKAYADFQRKVENGSLVKDDINEKIKELPLFPNKPENWAHMAELLLHFKNDWAHFITEMLHDVSKSAYGDENFHNVSATPQNRVTALAETALCIHSALAPQTRLNNKTYNLGPSSKEGFKFSGVLPVTYCVDTKSARYLIGGRNTEEAPLQVYESEMDFSYEESQYNKYEGSYNDYGIFPEVPKTHIPVKGTKVGDFNSSFFGGETKATQAASISSAAAGGGSPANPSLFIQETSTFDRQGQKHPLLGRIKAEFLRPAFAALLKHDHLKNLSVSTQWPNPSSTELDGRFVDGGYDDNTALIQSIVHYQAEDNADVSKILRVILCLNDIVKGLDENDDEVVKYFQNDSNIDVPIGDSLWCSCLANPLVSPQIFKEKVTIEDFKDNTRTLKTNSFKVTLLNGTTIDNPFVGVRAGQPVEILVIATNVAIPTLVIGSGLAKKYTKPMMDLATELATDEVLLEIVNDFVVGKINKIFLQPKTNTNCFLKFFEKL